MPPTTATKQDEQTNGTAPAAESTELATTTPAQPPAKSQVPVRMGLAPTTLEEAWRMSQFMAKSELVPKMYRNKPEEVLVAIQYGIELGFAPMQALQSIAVINGRPSVWGDGFLALIMAAPVYRDHDEYFLVKGDRRDVLVPDDLKDETTTAVCTFWRRDKQNPVHGFFSITQAKKAGLFGKEGPWQNYPDRMLKMRARGFAGRDAFPDVLRGVKTSEEAFDTPTDELPELPTRPAPVQPRRASEARTGPATSTSSTPAKADSAPQPATSQPSSAPSDEAEQVARGLKVTHTGFVKPRQGEPYYQVKMLSATGKEVVFLTRVEPVYREAASFEGTDHLVVASYHHDTQPDKTRVYVLDGLAIYEGAAPAAHSGELFD